MCQRADVFLDQCVYKGWGAGSQRRRASTAEEEINKYGKSFFFPFCLFPSSNVHLVTSHSHIQAHVSLWSQQLPHEKEEHIMKGRRTSSASLRVVLHVTGDGE